ncbi:unnamed protein product [Lota lota]
MSEHYHLHSFANALGLPIINDLLMNWGGNTHPMHYFTLFDGLCDICHLLWLRSLVEVCVCVCLHSHFIVQILSSPSPLVTTLSSSTGRCRVFVSWVTQGSPGTCWFPREQVP